MTDGQTARNLCRPAGGRWGHNIPTKLTSLCLPSSPPSNTPNSSSAASLLAELADSAMLFILQLMHTAVWLCRWWWIQEWEFCGDIYNICNTNCIFLWNGAILWRIAASSQMKPIWRSSSNTTHFVAISHIFVAWDKVFFRHLTNLNCLMGTLFFKKNHQHEMSGFVYGQSINKTTDWWEHLMTEVSHGRGGMATAYTGIEVEAWALP